MKPARVEKFPRDARGAAECPSSGTPTGVSLVSAWFSFSAQELRSSEAGTPRPNDFTSNPNSSTGAHLECRSVRGDGESAKLPGIARRLRREIRPSWASAPILMLCGAGLVIHFSELQFSHL